MDTRASKEKKVSTFPFEDLPVEIELKVMSYLDIRDLLRCTQISKKVRALCQDKSLWQKINLSWKKIPISFVNNPESSVTLTCIASSAVNVLKKYFL